VILQLLPEQVVSYWDRLEPLFLEALPPRYRDEKSAVSMLRAILMEDCQVWQLIDDEDNVKAFAITEVREDRIIGVRYLFLYLLVAEEVSSITMWRDALQALKKYAKSKACISVQAVTIVDEVAHLAERLGSVGNQQLLEFGVI